MANCSSETDYCVIMHHVKSGSARICRSFVHLCICVSLYQCICVHVLGIRHLSRITNMSMMFSPMRSPVRLPYACAAQSSVIEIARNLPMLFQLAPDQLEMVRRAEELCVPLLSALTCPFFFLRGDALKESEKRIRKEFV